MITFSCPTCDDDIEFYLASDEDAAMRPCLEVTEIRQPCSCPHTPEVWKQLEEAAKQSASDVHTDEG